MKDCSVLLTIDGVEYGLYFDFEAYLALERRGYKLGPLIDDLTNHAAGAARAALYEGIRGYQRAFPNAKHVEPDLEKVGGLVFANGLLDTCMDIARALRATYRRDKGVRGEDAEGKAVTPTSKT